MFNFIFLKKIILLILVLCSILYIGQEIVSYCMSGETMILNDDMHQEFLNAAIFRQSILEYKRFPMWSPHIGGGYPLYAYPHDISLLLPFTIPILVFGELIGVKFNILLIYLLGIGGMFLYLKHRYPQHLFIPIFFSFIYADSPRFTETLMSGNFNELFAYMFPLLLFFYLKGQKTHINLLYALFISAIMAIFGKFTYFFMILLLFLFTVKDFLIINARSFSKRKISYSHLIYFFIFIVFSGLFSLCKLLPAFLFVSRVSYHRDWLDIFRNVEYYDHLIFFLICLLLIQSYMFIRTFINNFTHPGKIWVVRIIQIAMIFSFFIGGFGNRVDVHCVTVKPHASSFYQIAGRFSDSNKPMSTNTLRTPSSLSYFNFLKNIGTIDWEDCLITIPTKVQPRYFVFAPSASSIIWNNICYSESIQKNPLYKGEAFFVKGNGKIIKTAFEPNKCIVTVGGKGRSLIAINQNYDSNWVSSRGKAINIDEILGIDVYLNGRTRIVLSYHPWLFYLSLFISITSIIACVYLIKHHKPFIRLISFHDQP